MTHGKTAEDAEIISLREFYNLIFRYVSDFAYRHGRSKIRSAQLEELPRMRQGRKLSYKRLVMHDTRRSGPNGE